MKQLFLVGLGGAFGSICRFKAGVFLSAQFPGVLWPATLWINVLGCFLIGILAALGEKRGILTPDARLFLMTGTLGGFTTFSAFGLETLGLLRAAKPSLALLYVTLSVLGGLVTVALGWQIVGWLTPPEQG